MDKAVVATIGFTQTTAAHFFERLMSSNVRHVIDVRLHNTSQLAGFAKSDDLAFFLKRLGDIRYRHEPQLAPTEQMLIAFKKQKGAWATYEAQFLGLMSERRVEEIFSADALDGACLLCSEAKPHQCHRRLVCDYLNQKWGGRLAIKHL